MPHDMLDDFLAESVIPFVVIAIKNQNGLRYLRVNAAFARLTEFTGAEPFDARQLKAAIVSQSRGTIV